MNARHRRIGEVAQPGPVSDLRDAPAAPGHRDHAHVVALQDGRVFLFRYGEASRGRTWDDLYERLSVLTAVRHGTAAHNVFPGDACVAFDATPPELTVAENLADDVGRVGGLAQALVEAQVLSPLTPVHQLSQNGARHPLGTLGDLVGAKLGLEMADAAGPEDAGHALRPGG